MRAIRLQHLTPVPRGESLAALPAWLRGEVDARQLRAVSVTRGVQVRVEGAWYSVPSRWAGLRAMASIGVDELTLRCRSEEAMHPP